MNFKLDVEFNADKDGREYGWYIYGYVERTDSITSKYATDTALVSVLVITLERYRNILKENGAIIVANGRTCFENRESALSVIPVIKEFIDYNMINW